MEAGSGDMTLAFELEALQALDDPAGAFSGARDWTEYVGVVSEEPTYVVTNYTRQKRIRQDFFSGPRGVLETLESVRDQFETERYVFLGTSKEDEAIAGEAGWEYLAVEEAAEAAGWRLATDVTPDQSSSEETRDDWP